MKRICLIAMVTLAVVIGLLLIIKNKGNSNDPLYYLLASFPSNGLDVHICTSEDGKMRFYSRNTGEGGTMPIYGVLCQYKTSDGESKVVNLGADDTEVAWVSDVHSIKKNDGSTYYIMVRDHKTSSVNGYSWLDAYSIENDTLKRVNVLNGREYDETDNLVINYNIPDWYDITCGEGWDWLYEYDMENRNLYVPDVLINDDPTGYLTDRYYLYHFNGEEFIKMGNVPHRGLHESLAEYDELVLFFRTKNHIVRLDYVNGNFRYASWEATSSISEKPDIIIYNGERDDDAKTFVFVKGNYEYTVRLEPNVKLMVKENGKVIVKEERIWM